MSGRQIVRHQALHRHRHGGFLSLNLRRNLQPGRLLPELADASRKRMIRHFPLGFTMGRLADLFRHMTGLAFFTGLHGFALVPIPQEIVTLAEIGRGRHDLMTIEAEV
jgi:hypothetical protein